MVFFKSAELTNLYFEFCLQQNVRGVVDMDSDPTNKYIDPDPDTAIKYVFLVSINYSPK